MDITTSPSLLQRLRIEGNERDWEVFFALYARPIYGLALHFGLPSEQAEDVVQETMIAIMRRLPEFDYDPERARFRTWLWRIVKNITVDHWRRTQRRPTVPYDQAAHASQTMDSPHQDEAIERTWRLALVREGLRLLEADTQIRSQTLKIFRSLVIDGEDPDVIANRYQVRRKIVAALESGKLQPLTEPEPPEPTTEVL
jgi:RNA polymerase sigma factor (sigma-70 family)